MTVLAHSFAPAPAWWEQVLPAVGIAVAALAYAAGLVALGRRSMVRGVERHGRLRAAAFAAGLAAVAVAVSSPLATQAETYFSAHMVQHMVLVAVAAPLLAVGAPGLPVLLALPLGLRRRMARALPRWRDSVPVSLVALPVTAWFLHIGALWAWHMPAAYDAALRSEPAHVAEHLSFLVTAWLLWWHVVTPGPRRIGRPVAAMFLFTVLLPSAALGAVLTLARSPLYAEQAARTASAGVDPLRDQQLAGLVMWVPADVVYIVAIVGLVFAWLTGRHTSNARQKRRAGYFTRRGPDPLVLPPEEVSR